MSKEIQGLDNIIITLLDDFDDNFNNSLQGKQFDYKEKAKQAILNWVNETVIGEDINLKTLRRRVQEATAVNERLAISRHTLKQHGWKEGNK